MEPDQATQMPIRLVVLTGPIGAGKSTIAELLARRVAPTRRSAAVVDLDDVAFTQRGQLEPAEFWRRAGMVHASMVRSWFAAGTDVVVAHGPFFESRSYDELFASTPTGAKALHVLLQVTFEQALARVTADPDRPPTAASRDPDFLRETHEAFSLRQRTLPTVDIEIDTQSRSPRSVADELVRAVLS